MSKFLLMALALACLCTPAIAETPSRLWVRVMSDPQSGNTHYFDLNSLVSTTSENGNRVNLFDSKIIFSRPVQSEVYFAIIQVQISCTNRTIRSLRFEQYDAQERLIGVEELAHEWYNIPSTNTTAANIMNGFYTLACSQPS